MGFTTPNLPEVEPEAFLAKPFLERVKTLTLNWVDNGYGVPRMVHAIYIVKLVLFYALGGVVVATVTSGLPAFWHVSQWWNQPIVYQKVILWTVLLETIGVAGSWGPLAGKTKPMMGGILYLGAARHDQAAAVAAGSLHRGQPSHLVRRGCLPGLDRQCRRAAGVSRRAQRFAVGGVAEQHVRSGEPRAADRTDGAARLDRVAGQDDLSGRPR